MRHEMNLHPEPFRMIARGEKTIELRLYDEKRRRIRVGDEIAFTCTAEPHDTLCAEVIGIYRYDSFIELYADLPLLKCGYTAADIADAKPEDMDAYYSKEQQERYGVIGIESRVLR